MKKYGSAEDSRIIPEGDDNQKVASAAWDEEDRKALAEENAKADREGSEDR